MSDTIYRQDAIDALGTPHGILYPIRTIESLPAAQPEPSQVARDIATIIENEQDMRVMLQPQRKKGHWIYRGPDRILKWICPFCHRVDCYFFNFCPDCGADLRREDQDD